jgi:PAS domain-containing protein
VLCATGSIVDLLGYSADDIDAIEPFGLAQFVHPDDLHLVAEHYEKLAALRYGEVIQIQYRMKHSDGSWCQLNSQETVLIPEAHEAVPSQVLGIIQDVTRISMDDPQTAVRSIKPFRR